MSNPSQYLSHFDILPDFLGARCAGAVQEISMEEAGENISAPALGFSQMASFDRAKTYFECRVTTLVTDTMRADQRALEKPDKLERKIKDLVMWLGGFSATVRGGQPITIVYNLLVPPQTDEWLWREKQDPINKDKAIAMGDDMTVCCGEEAEFTGLPEHEMGVTSVDISARLADTPVFVSDSVGAARFVASYPVEITGSLEAARDILEGMRDVFGEAHSFIALGVRKDNPKEIGRVGSMALFSMTFRAADMLIPELAKEV